ncbi:MAG TPA: ferredoxin family protein [Methanocorpusculum sp.]|nr:ferredoxin family protein [Methanocorpusculum sp.]
MKIVIDEHRCKGCNLCVKMCPAKIFQEGTNINTRGYVVPLPNQPERCMNNVHSQTKTDLQRCGICKLICPDQAISWIYDAQLSHVPDGD